MGSFYQSFIINFVSFLKAHSNIQIKTIFYPKLLMRKIDLQSIFTKKISIECKTKNRYLLLLEIRMFHYWEQKTDNFFRQSFQCRKLLYSVWFFFKQKLTIDKTYQGTLYLVDLNIHTNNSSENVEIGFHKQLKKYF